MDMETRQQLLRAVEALLPDTLKEVNTEEEGIENTFEALHFRIYSKFAKNASLFIFLFISHLHRDSQFFLGRATIHLHMQIHLHCNAMEESEFILVLIFQG